MDDSAYDSSIGILTSSPSRRARSNCVVSPLASDVLNHFAEQQHNPPSPDTTTDADTASDQPKNSKAEQECIERGSEVGLELDLDLHDGAPALPSLAGEEGKYAGAETDTDTIHDFDYVFEAGLTATDADLNDSFQAPSESEMRPSSPAASMRRLSSRSSSVGSAGSSMRVARIAMPTELQNVTFYQLFLHLFKTARIVAFAIYREPSSARKEDLPVTFTCPDPNTRMRKSDHIFVFT